MFPHLIIFFSETSQPLNLYFVNKRPSFAQVNVFHNTDTNNYDLKSQKVSMLEDIYIFFTILLI
jgi:hypothetical protein